MKKTYSLCTAHHRDCRPLFFQAVKTLTNNQFILSGYWYFDIAIVAGLLLIMFTGVRKLVPVLLTLVLLSIIPKVFAMPVLLLEDITRLFRSFPPRSVWVSGVALIVAAIPFLGLLYGLTSGRHYYKNP